MIVVLLTTTTLVAAAPPNVTVAPATKFVPVIVTAVPPAVDPLFGLTLLTVGGNNISEPAGQASALPVHRHRHRHRTGAPAGVVAVIDVLLTTTTLVAAVPPNVTVAPAAKFVPVIVTAVPPAVGPLFGDSHCSPSA